MIEYEEHSDSDLVKEWQTAQCDKALNVLVKRHYKTIYRRMKAKTNNREDAKEITQDAFLKLVKNLESYKDNGKFTNFLNTIATTTLIDFYRKNGTSFDEESLEYEMQLDNENSRNDDISYLAEKKVEYLTTHCVPQLPPKERLVFLLLHESELWDSDTPLEWSHIATLNGIDKETAWARFESAREILMKGLPAEKVDIEELLIFLLWTQANRPFKTGYTLKYFANLIGEAEQNLRNWSHKAKNNLNESLSQYAQA